MPCGRHAHATASPVTMPLCVESALRFIVCKLTSLRCYVPWHSGVHLAPHQWAWYTFAMRSESEPSGSESPCIDRQQALLALPAPCSREL